jgi:predicted RNase H-like HicB family nuclease
MKMSASDRLRGERRMKIELTAVYEPQADGWIAASIAEIPGVLSQGKTMPEAREMLADALHQILESNRELAVAAAGPNAVVEGFDLELASTT